MSEPFLTFARLRRSLSLIAPLLPVVANAQTQTLSVLCPHGLLDFKVISEFERSTRVNLRVELTQGRREFEMRLKHSVSSWDVVIADENELSTLAYARLTRPLRDDKEPADSRLGPLGQRVRTQDETKAYVPLMADPLGVAWLEGTRGDAAPLSWKSLTNPKENPLWRARVFLPSEPGFQFRIAMLATGLTNPQAPATTMAPAFDWLRSARHQGTGQSSQLLLSLVEEKIVAGPMWKSDYLRARKLVRSMEFAVPAEGTYFTRFGAAVVADTLREDVALSFISFLTTRRDELARFAGLLPLTSTVVDVPGLANWHHYDESIPLHREVEEALRKVIASP